MAQKLFKILLLTLAICFQLAESQIVAGTPKESSLFKKEDLAVPTDPCIMAPVFGMKTGEVRLVKPNELKVCKNLSQTCCAAESFNALPTRWENHIKAQGKLVWTKIRIVRLLLRLRDNLGDAAINCVKNNPKLLAKLARPPKPSRRMQQTTKPGQTRTPKPTPTATAAPKATSAPRDPLTATPKPKPAHPENPKKVEEGLIIIPHSHHDSSKPHHKLKCSPEATKFLFLSKKFDKVSGPFERSLKKCASTMNFLQSEMICASCDPTANNSIIGYKKI
jgi:hypothetical protein